MARKVPFAVVVALAAAAAASASAPPSLDPARLPKLPPQGIVRDTNRGVVLETLRGRRIGFLKGLNVAPDRATHGVTFVDRGGRLLGLDLAARRLRQVVPMQTASGGCRFVDATMRDRLRVCARQLELVSSRPGQRPQRHVVARTPKYKGKPARGRWLWAELAPSGNAILAQWSGECEIPTAFLIARGRMTPYGAASYAEAPESMALGWLKDGRAVVAFWSGICGSGYGVPGVYAVPRRGRPQLLRRAAPLEVTTIAAMWGG